MDPWLIFGLVLWISQSACGVQLYHGAINGGEVCADIFVLIDRSCSIADEHKDMMKDYLIDLINMFDEDVLEEGGGIRFAMGTFAKVEHFTQTLQFSESVSKEAVLSAVNAMDVHIPDALPAERERYCATETNLVLPEIRKIFNNRKHKNPHKKLILMYDGVTYLDGPLDASDETIKEANKLKRDGIQIYVLRAPNINNKDWWRLELMGRNVETDALPSWGLVFKPKAKPSKHYAVQNLLFDLMTKNRRNKADAMMQSFDEETEHAGILRWTQVGRQECIPSPPPDFPSPPGGPSGDDPGTKCYDLVLLVDTSCSVGVPDDELRDLVYALVRTLVDLPNNRIGLVSFDQHSTSQIYLVNFTTGNDKGALLKHIENIITLAHKRCLTSTWKALKDMLEEHFTGDEADGDREEFANIGIMIGDGVTFRRNKRKWTLKQAKKVRKRPDLEMFVIKMVNKWGNDGTIEFDAIASPDSNGIQHQFDYEEDHLALAQKIFDNIDPVEYSCVAK